MGQELQSLGLVFDCNSKPVYNKYNTKLLLESWLQLMLDQKKLDRWASELLDTGKRNALINFKDKKSLTAEILFPESEEFFKQCSLGKSFEVFNPGITDEESDSSKTTDAEENKYKSEKTKKELFKERNIPRIRTKQSILAYAQTPNPVIAVRNIAKKEAEIQDETGVNVAFLAFGFVEWAEKEGSKQSFKAPLLLLHVNVTSGSILDPVKIEICDDDVIINPTFDYLLQADFGISLPPIADDDSLSSYCAKVASATKKLGWNVTEECKLGLFSFQKINMYSDLKQNANLILSNNNVRALLGETALKDLGFGNGEEHVVKNPLIDLHTVVEADSSQIQAIEMAKSGKSFVLQGPPGTGKSQTITNVIAECLHDGKKVLFVSEKQAALNVVYDKLKKAGLAEFCLELHSHKANKKAVIQELNRTLEIPKMAVSSSAYQDIQIKETAQHILDGYANALHKTREPIHKSFFELLNDYSAEKRYPELHLHLLNIQSKGAEYYNSAVAFLNQYSDYIPSIGQNYKENTWYGFNRTNISFDEKLQLESNLNRLLQSQTELEDTVSTIAQKYGVVTKTQSDVIENKELLSFLAETDVITPALLSATTFRSLYPHFEKMKEIAESIIPIRDEILHDFIPDIIKYVDGSSLLQTLQDQYSNTFSRTFNSDYKKLVAAVKHYSLNDTSCSYSQLLNLAKNLVQLQQLSSSFEEEENLTNDHIGASYSGIETDWNHVLSELDTLRKIFSNKPHIFENISSLTKAQFLNEQSSFRSYANKLDTESADIASISETIVKFFDSSLIGLNSMSPDDMVHKVQSWVVGLDLLPNWCDFIELLKNLENLGLMPYIDTVIEKQIAKEDVTGSFQRAFHQMWIEYLLYSVPELHSFSRIKQDRSVMQFNDKDVAQYEISKSQIISELSQQRPNVEMAASGSALSILRREGAKKRKQKPIRILLSETSDLVQTLKPCFLMSPLSVSTFLEPGTISFDTIIFDEASQIFPQDAIGAIYRGKQLIVVGDSKQMPPSNFFNASTEIEDEDEELSDITNYESILDICSATFPTERLAWHYRSHYEQLIAFSNQHFYNGRLVTFPSATRDHKGIGVDYYHVDGIFDRKSHTNRAEADFIVDLIYKNIEEFPNRSLGVVAFSRSQQDLIDELLSKKRQESPHYEEFFSSSKAEPFFIKNLESVQGDERDTIIFSVAYAKDINGLFYHNFGPLNRDGGERRLNVAVTRAKENVQLVASIYYTDIDLNRTQSEGARLLRAYLDYAQNGPLALEREITLTGEDQFDSAFEQEVCDFLRDNGYTVDTQVGCSGYRIDLGLRAPNSSDYVLAIECDGATYHSSKNARDRDRLRQSVLENMGWEFYRIWSTDWYRNTAVEKEALLQAARLALINKRVEKVKPKIVKPKVSSGRPDSSNRYSVVTKAAPIEFPKYVQVDASNLILYYAGDFLGAIREILETEAPLSEDYLLKRIVHLFGSEKVTSSIRNRFDARMWRCTDHGIIRKNGFIYLQGSTNYQLRVPGEKREIKYISPEELASGFYSLIKENVATPKDELFRTMTKILGYSRTGDAIVNHYERAISLLDQGGLIEKDGDMLKIVQQSSNLKEITTQEEPPAQPQLQTRPGKQKVKIRKVQL